MNQWLSLSVDLHKYSMKDFGESVVDGVMTGKMKLDDTVTWKARHFFRERRMTVRITRLQRPDFFIDEQTKGDLHMMKHEHYFKPAENGTIMIDQFHFESLKNFTGKLLDRFYLQGYLKKLLEQRNQAIRHAAESNQWKQFLIA